MKKAFFKSECPFAECVCVKIVVSKEELVTGISMAIS